MSAPVELIVEDDEDSILESEREGENRLRTLNKKVVPKLYNLDTNEVEKTFVHEIRLSFKLGDPKKTKKKDLKNQEERLIVLYTESNEWSVFWRNTIQGLHDSNRKFTYNQNIKREDVLDVKLLDSIRNKEDEKNDNHGILEASHKRNQNKRSRTIT